MNIGSGESNQAGLADTFEAVNSVATIATGTAAGPLLPAGATLPIAKIETLADILASCANSTDVTAGGIGSGGFSVLSDGGISLPAAIAINGDAGSN